LMTVSDTLLSDITYTNGPETGIGSALKSFVNNNGTIYFIDPYREAIIRAGYNGVDDISYKVSTTLKDIIKEEKSLGNLSDVQAFFNKDKQEYFILFSQGNYVFSEPVEKWICRFPVNTLTYGFSCDNRFYIVNDNAEVWEF